MMLYQDAYQQILSQINLLSYESVNILEAMNRVLREDIYAPHDLPPYNLSAMDGYAVRSKDIQTANESSPMKLNVIKKIPAGNFTHEKVSPGGAMRIFTGAPIPDGADAVVIQEVTELKNRTVMIKKPVSPNENIRFAGEDVKKGELVMGEGKILRPVEIEMLGSLGFTKVKVSKRPVVAIIPTGDEIIPIEENITPGKVRNGNQYGIAAAVIRCHGKLILSKIVKDNVNDLESRIQDSIDAGADVIVSIGGVSVGDYDLTKDVFQKMGKIDLWCVAVQPGKPLAFGFIQDKPIFGLPGFPVSCMVIFELFVRPALLKMQGIKNFECPVIPAILDENIKRQPGRLAFFRGIAYKDEKGEYHVRTTGPQGSGIIRSLVQANVFIEIPMDCAKLQKGDIVNICFPSILEE